VEFEPDATPSTTGDGTFLAEPAWPDSLPHDLPFFRRQLDHLEAYWAQVSGGRAGFGAELHGQVLRLPDPMARYGADDQSGRRVAELLRDAILAADPAVDFSPYTGVMVIHAGAGQESDLLLDSSDDIWSSYISRVDLEEELDLPEGIETADGVAFTEGVIVPESEIQDAPELDPRSNLATLGVMAFETGHFFALPDLFDTGPAPQDSWGIGAWGVMGLGAWNSNGYVPPHPCAWSKLRLGWIDAVAARSGDTLTLAAVEGAGPVLRIDATPTESFLAAYRLGDENGNGCFDFTDPEGDDHFDYYDPGSGDSYLGAELDYYLPTGSGDRCGGSSAGVLIWHLDQQVIDERGSLEVNLVNDDAGRKGVDLEEASGVQNLDQFPGSWGDSLDFWLAGARFGPDSQPGSSTNSGARTGWALEVVAIDQSRASLVATIDLAQRGWPVEIGDEVTGDVLAADFDLDGAADVVVAGAGGAAHLIWGGGVDATPLAIGPSSGPGGVAAIDLDGDQVPELLLTSGAGEALAYRLADAAAGRLPVPEPLPAPWGAVLGERFRHAPASADLDADGAPEVVLLALPEGRESETDLLLLDAGGALLAEVVLNGAVLAPPLLASDGRIALVSAGALRVFRWDGAVLSAVGTAPLAGTVQSPLAAADLDGDGGDELLVLEDEGRAHLFDSELREYFGWPVEVGARLAGGVAVADLGGDGRLDILATSSDPTELRRWDLSGDGVLDWHDPRLAEGGEAVVAVTAGVLAADLDGDGVEELIAALPTGVIRALDPGASGTDADTPQGFPLQQAGSVSYTPAVADVDGDGDFELVVAEDPGRIMAWDFPGRSLPTWAQAGGGPGRAGSFPGPYPEPGDPPAALLDLAFVYPNPARGHARLHYRLGEGATALTIRVVDARGELASKTVLRDPQALAPGDHYWAWDLDGVPRGVYLLLVQARSAVGSARQVVKAAVVGGGS